MYFNLEKAIGKKVDLNPLQVVTRSITPIKNRMDKSMKLQEEIAKKDETPDYYLATIYTTLPGLIFNVKCDKYEEAEEFLKKFKEDL